MWLVCTSEGKGKTTTLAQIAVNLTTNTNDRVMFIGGADPPDLLVEAWQANHYKGPNGRKGNHQERKRNTPGSCLANIDMRYVKDADELKGTLSCFHLIPDHRKPKALLIDDLDKLVARVSLASSSASAQKNKKRNENGRKKDGYGAFEFEARLAKMSAYLKNVAQHLNGSQESGEGEGDETFSVVASITKAKGEEETGIPYYSTLKRWFTHIAEITDNLEVRLEEEGEEEAGVLLSSKTHGKTDFSIIKSTVQTCPLQGFVLSRKRGYSGGISL